MFDREVFQRVRDEDLGRVRGQPIRPVLAGFGEPVTDWLFQSAMEARPGESAFAVQAGPDWPYGEGWLCVFGLRWLGPARQVAAPDSLVPVFCGANGEPKQLAASETAALMAGAEGVDTRSGALVPLPDVALARGVAQRVLRERVANREPATRAGVGLSLLWLAVVVRSDKMAEEAVRASAREASGSESNRDAVLDVGLRSTWCSRGVHTARGVAWVPTI